MKHRYAYWIPALLVLAITACGGAKQAGKTPAGRDYSGTYTGYSWKDEAKGTALSDATEKIETILTLDTTGTITAVSIDFLVKRSDGSWYKRNDPGAELTVDFTVAPAAATPQTATQAYVAGKSMFKIKTNDMMSFFAVAVAADTTVAFALVDPIHRYLTEMKLPAGFDYNTKISQLTIGSGLIVPTIRTSSSGYLKPDSWQDQASKHLFGFYQSPYVYTGRGTFKGLTTESSVRELLEKAGVRFENTRPVAMAPVHGFYANGGWTGNYAAMRQFLVGKKATELLSLVDWSIPRYAGAINTDNFFGIDAQAGATKTVQNSTDGIAGATVRISREATSYQRALVAAGILEEAKVIKGRF